MRLSVSFNCVISYRFWVVIAGGPFQPPHALGAVAGVAPAVPSFLRVHSAVVVAMQHDPAADWVTALPPAATVADFERQRRHLGVLQELEVTGGSLKPFCVCHVRSKPLFDCLAAISKGDLPEMLRLADYLQLPKALALAVAPPSTAVCTF